MVTGWLLSNILVAVAVLKALKNIRGADGFGFLSLVCLRKRAFDTASKQKTHAVRVGFVTPSGFKPETF